MCIGEKMGRREEMYTFNRMRDQTLVIPVICSGGEISRLAHVYSRLTSLLVD